MNPEAITTSLIILGVLVIISFLKEKIENMKFQPPSNQSNPSIEDAKISFETPSSAVEAEASLQPQKSTGRIIASYDIPSGIWANKKAKAKKYMLTESMIDKLKYIDTSSFMARALISTMVPGQLLDTMIKKARNDELKPGMVIRLAKGKLTIEQP